MPRSPGLHLLLANWGLSEFDLFIDIAKRDMLDDPAGWLLSGLTRALRDAVHEIQQDGDADIAHSIARGAEDLNEVLLSFASRVLSDRPNRSEREDLYRELSETHCSADESRTSVFFTDHVSIYWLGFWEQDTGDLPVHDDGDSPVALPR